MLHQTKGIFLHKVKYGDSSFIVKIFTEKFGLQSYIVRGISSSRNKKSALFQSLSLLDLIVYHKSGKTLQNIKEIQVDQAFQSIHTQIQKSTITMFLNEVLYHAIKEEEQNTELFNFIYGSLLQLDNESGTNSDFHHRFLLQLSRFLGIGPQNNYSDINIYFNIREAFFVPHLDNSIYVLNQELSTIFLAYLNNSRPESKPNYRQRKQLLDWIIKYYQIHIHGFPEVKSMEVLQTIFD